MPRSKGLRIQKTRRRRQKVFTEHDDRTDSDSNESSSDSRSSQNESGDDLKPIEDYLKNRPEMVRQMFHAVPAKHLNAILPDVLKDVPLSELQRLSTEQLSVMSKKRIRHILAAKEMSSSSGTEESSSSEESTKEDQGIEPVSRLKTSSPELQQPDSTSTEQVPSKGVNLPDTEITSCIENVSASEMYTSSANSINNVEGARPSDVGLASSQEGNTKDDVTNEGKVSSDQNYCYLSASTSNVVVDPNSVKDDRPSTPLCDELSATGPSTASPVKPEVGDISSEHEEDLPVADSVRSETVFDYGRATSPLDYDEDSCHSEVADSAQRTENKQVDFDETFSPPKDASVKQADACLEDGEIDNNFANSLSDMANVDDGALPKRYEDVDLALSAETRKKDVISEAETTLDRADLVSNCEPETTKLDGVTENPCQNTDVASELGAVQSDVLQHETIVRSVAEKISGQDSLLLEEASAEEKVEEAADAKEPKVKSVEHYDSEHESGEYVSDEEPCPPGLEPKRKLAVRESKVDAAQSQTDATRPPESSESRTTKKSTNLVAIKTLYEHLKAEKQRKKKEPRPKRYGAQPPAWTSADPSQTTVSTAKQGPSLPPKSDLMLDEVTARDRRNRQLYNELLDDYGDKEKSKAAKERKTKKKSNIVLTEQFLADLDRQSLQHEQEMDEKAQKLAELKRERLRLLEEEKEAEFDMKKRIDLGLFEKERQRPVGQKQAHVDNVRSSTNQHSTSPVSSPNDEGDPSPNAPDDPKSAQRNRPRSKISSSAPHGHSSSSRLRSDRPTYQNRRVVLGGGRTDASAAAGSGQSGRVDQSKARSRDVGQSRKRAAHYYADQPETSGRGHADDDRKAERMRRAFTLESSSSSEEGEVEHELTVRGRYQDERRIDRRRRDDRRTVDEAYRSRLPKRARYDDCADYDRVAPVPRRKDYDEDYCKVEPGREVYKRTCSEYDRERRTGNSYSKTTGKMESESGAFKRRYKPDDYDSDYLKRDNDSEHYKLKDGKVRKSEVNRVENISSSEDERGEEKVERAERTKAKSVKKAVAQEKKSRLSRLVVDAAATAAKSSSVPYQDCATNEALLLRKLELYELEMRARAIRALMKKQGKPE